MPRRLFATRAACPANPAEARAGAQLLVANGWLRIRPECGRLHPLSDHPPPRFEDGDNQVRPALPALPVIFLLRRARQTAARLADSPRPLPARNSSATANASRRKRYATREKSRKTR